jgi:CheY-like chemotaxis protein
MSHAPGVGITEPGFQTVTTTHLRGGPMSTTTPTILLAEEHDATRAFLADNLTADGYQVLTAPDRPKALALLGTAHPDLIVVDVNGQTLALLDAIRSSDGLAGRVTLIRR